MIHVTCQWCSFNSSNHAFSHPSSNSSSWIFIHPFLLSSIHPSIHSLFIFNSPSFPHSLGCQWCVHSSHQIINLSIHSFSFTHPSTPYSSSTHLPSHIGWGANDDVHSSHLTIFPLIHMYTFIHSFSILFIHSSIHPLFLLHSPFFPYTLECQWWCSFKSSNHSFSHACIHPILLLFIYLSIPYSFSTHLPSHIRLDHWNANDDVHSSHLIIHSFIHPSINSFIHPFLIPSPLTFLPT